ncbi:MAG: DUF4340 domain-containing protein [Oscillospiraceae bacterium]|nr:DUF4340 domain-containing protein [Oscillospiraceae bacterium]
MRKKLMITGGLAALLLVLGLGFFIVWQEEAHENESTGPAELAFLFQYDMPPLSAHFSGGYREPFTLLRLEIDPARNNMVSRATIPGMEDLPVDSARIGGVLGASRNLPYLELVDVEVADLRVFGLNPARATVVLDFEEQGTRTIKIGDVAPGNVGVYIQLDEDGAIYLVPVTAVDNFLLTPFDYMNMNITPMSGWPMVFDSMTLGGAVREETGEVTIVANRGEFELTAPFAHELNPLTGPGILHAAFGMIAHRVVAVNPSQADLDALGFDRPWSTLTVEGGEYGGFSILATQPDEAGMVLIYREGVPLLYSIGEHGLLWLDVQFYQLMSPFAASPLLEELAAVQVAVFGGRGGHVHVFEIERDEEDAPIVTTPDLTLDTENFRRFFTTLISATLEMHEDQQTEPGRPVLNFIYRYADGTDLTVSFYESNVPLRHFARVNEGRVFLTPSSYIDRVLGDLLEVWEDRRVEAI